MQRRHLNYIRLGLHRVTNVPRHQADALGRSMADAGVAMFETLDGAE